MIKNAVYGSVGYLMEPAQRLIRLQCHTFHIAKEEKEKNVGIWRQSRDPLQHLAIGKIVVVGKPDPAGEGLGCLLERLPPGVVERRRTKDDFDIFRCRC